jgi:hypothetical protein
MPGIDVYTKLLLHGDGTDGSTSFPDASIFPKTITVNGSAQVDTAQSKFGGASMLFTAASSDWLASVNNADYDFYTTDWTVDFWIRRNGSQPDFTGIISGDNGTTGWEIHWGYAAGSSTNKIRFVYSGTQYGVSTTTLSDLTWYHVSVGREGNNIKIYINGTLESTVSCSGVTFNSGGAGICIGKLRIGTNGYYFNGWIDELRITKGLARWTANFTSPTSAYTEQYGYTSNVFTGGTATASSTNGTEVASRAFDGLIAEGNFWTSSTTGSMPQWLKYDLGSGVTKTLTRYGLAVRTQFSDGIPSAWTFEGSNNDSTWDTLDSRTGQTWSNASQRYYTFENTTAYRYYRINFTASSHVYVHVMELQGFETNQAIDVYTATLLHANGVNTALLFDDLGTSARTFVPAATAQIDTSQSKFGGASLKSQSSSTISSFGTLGADWHWGTADFTIDGWIRLASTATNQGICGTNVDGSNYNYFAVNETGGSNNNIRFRAYQSAGGNINFSIANTLSINTWYHIAIVRASNIFKIYLNGTAIFTSGTVTDALIPRTAAFNIGSSFGASSYPFNGWIDEFRLSVGIARWTSNFTPPTQEYPPAVDITVQPSNLSSTSVIQAPTVIGDANISTTTLDITSSVQEPYYVGEIQIVTPTHITATSEVQEASVVISSSVSPNVVGITALVQGPDLIIDSQFSVDKGDIVSSVEDPYYVGPLEIQLPPGLSITSNVEPVSIRVDKTVYPDAINLVSNLFGTIEAIESFIKNASRIISYNPLIIIDNSDPLQIGVIDTADPLNPTINIYVLANIPVTGGYDVFVDEINGYFYIACNSGEVAKVQISDPSNFTVYDVNDTDNLTSVLYNDIDSLIHVSTSSSPAEVYTIDNRTEYALQTDLRCNADTVRYINTNFRTQEGRTLNTNLTTLTDTQAMLRTSLVILTEDYNALSPIGREAFDIRIDGVSLDARDLDLSSIKITHSIGERSQALFKLAREHDDLNRNYNGTTIPITNQNLVEIYINGHLEFTGRTAQINADYGPRTDNVEVMAKSDAITDDFVINSVLLPLPGLDEKRHLYHIITEAPDIYNPYLDPNDPNPEMYRGIRVPAGMYKKDINYIWKLFTNVGSVSSIYIKDLDFGFANPSPVSEDFTITNSFGDDEVIRLDSGVAYELQNGLFVPVPGWQYFWFAAYAFTNTTIESSTEYTVIRSVNGRTTQTTTNLETGETTEKVLFNGGSNKWSDALHSNTLYYIGTNVSNGKSNLWTLAKATYYRQKQDEPIEYHLGTGVVTVQNFEDEFPTRGQEMFDVCVANGYLLSDGTITWKFKNCTNIYKPIIDDSIDMEEYMDKKFNIGYGQTYTNKAYSLIESFLGFYRGEAPFKDVSTASGVYIPAERYEDRDDGLYRTREEAYDYRNYGLLVADLEYQKLLNINGEVLPITSMNIATTIDAYYFYDLKLLNRVNISNTTYANIYNSNNGFPTAIKSIQIESDSMTVLLKTDNEQSEEELEEIESRYPIVDDYKQLAYAKLQFRKYDVNTGEAIFKRDGVA